MSRQGKLAALASTGVTKAELDLLDGVTSTTAELNITDGVTATAAEINLIDGGTARGTTAVADGDGFLTNDGGTMRMTKVDTLATYMGTKIGGGLEFIASTDVSDAATANFTGFDSSKYDSYKFTLANILPATDGAYLAVRASVDSGSNYLSASDSYSIVSNAGFSAGDSAYILSTYAALGNSASTDGGYSGICNVIGPHLNSITYIYFQGMASKTDGSLDQYALDSYGSGKTKVATVVNAVQFLCNTGNIASGTITMYGIVNS